jgi:hypothetical protein
VDDQQKVAQGRRKAFFAVHLVEKKRFSTGPIDVFM